MSSEQSKIKKAFFSFIMRYTTRNTMKSIIKMVQTELPSLLGFEHCVVIGHNQNSGMLESIVLDGDTERRKSAPPGFEHEFVIDKALVAEFISTAGISGFVFRNEAVCYISGPDSQPICFSKGTDLELNSIVNCEFDYKIDNFKLYNLVNAAYCNLLDEDSAEGQRCVGVLQLINKTDDNITQADLTKLFYIRKLIGSQSERAKLIEACLQTVLIMRINEETIRKLDLRTDWLEHAEIIMLAVQQTIPSYKI